MRMILLILLLLLQRPFTDNKYPEKYLKFNTCEFKNLNFHVAKIKGINIIRYSIVNNQNKAKDWISEYFLVHSSKGTFNVIQIFNFSSSDSFVKKYRLSNN